MNFVRGAQFKAIKYLVSKGHSKFIIYSIRNIADGRIYIGQTTDLIQRVKVHAGSLRRILGSPKDWVVKILYVRTFDKPVKLMSPEASEITCLERKYIKKTAKRYGNKCVNTIGRF